MGDKKNVFGGGTTLSIKYSDVFSMKELYNFIRDWLLEKGYTTESSEKWMETYYYENISQTSGKDMFITWRTEKDSQSKFIKFHLHIDYRVIAMKDIETTYKGKKVKAQKGEVEIIFTGFLEQDPKGEFEKGSFLTKPLMQFFEKRMYKSNIEEIKKGIIMDMKELHEKTKNFLEMANSIEFEPFRPRRGL